MAITNPTMNNYTYTTTSIGEPFLTTGTNTVDVQGSLVVKGRNVMAELDEMRDALLLLKRDVDMEKKYPELAEAKQHYEKILDKYKTWDALNYGNDEQRN